MKTYKVLKYERTEYAKAIRKYYEKGIIQEKRCNMRRFTLGEDVCNTITSVEKDNYILVITEDWILEHKNELRFLCGITDNVRLDNGKNFSRNYHERDRVYDSSGIACAIALTESGYYLVRKENDWKP